MDKIILNTQARETIGKGACKKLRQKDMIPAVVYKQGQKTLSIQVETAEFIHALHTSAGENAIITLEFPSSKKETPAGKQTGKTKGSAGAKTVIIKEIQYHPIKENILHVDFQEISLTEKITVNVPIVLKGESVGVKTDGGVLEHITKELEVECLPTQIPEKIELNVEQMKIGDIVHIKELATPAEIKVLTDSEQAVVSVSPPAKEEEILPPEEAAEEAQEPEVIAEKKVEEREAAEAAEEQAKEKEGKPKEGKPKEGKEKETK